MKEIPGVPGFYADEDGGIHSHQPGRKPKKVSPEVTRLGYLRFGYGHRPRKRMLVHRAVALAYIPRPEWATELNHKDGNKANNSVANLEWSTRSKNLQHAFDSGLINPRRGSAIHNAKLTEDQAREIKRQLAADQSRGIQARLGRQYGVTKEAIGLIKNGKNWGWLSDEIPA